MMCPREPRINMAVLVAAFACYFLPSPAASALPYGDSPATILSVATENAKLRVTVHVMAAFGPESPLELRWLTLDGELLSAQSIHPAPDNQPQEIYLDGRFADVSSRGWQHELELVSDEGLMLHRLDVRLGLDCADDPELCHVVARPGERLEGAVRLSPQIADLLTSDADLAEVARNEPELRGDIYEAALDLARRAAPEARCTCFYTGYVSPAGGATHSLVRTTLQPTLTATDIVGFRHEEVNTHDRFRVSQHTTRAIAVDFQCGQIGSLQMVQVQTSAGTMSLPVPGFKYCATSCAAPVEWSLLDLYEKSVLVSDGWAEAETSYRLAWHLDHSSQPAQVLGGDWSASGTMLAPPRIDESQLAFPTGVITLGAPSYAELKARSTVEIRDWSIYDLPQGQMSAGATLQAVGDSDCADPLLVRATPSIYADGAYPTLLLLDVGPEEEEP